MIRKWKKKMKRTRELEGYKWEGKKDNMEGKGGRKGRIEWKKEMGKEG